MKAVNEESDLEVITPVPIDNIGEYFYFPLNKNIGVSKDGKIIKFNSVKACANYFNIHRSTLFKHLKQGKIDLYHKEFFVFKFDNNAPWVIQPKEKLRLLSDKSNLGIPIVITYKDKSKPNVICDGYKGASIITELPIATIYRNLIKHRLYETNRIKIQYATDLIK